MKLHYKGKYDLNPNSLPHGEHKDGAVKFDEPETTAELGKKTSGISLVLLAFLFTALLYRCGNPPSNHWLIGMLLFVIAMVPHEMLHALCFKGDVYFYTNLAQGMLFVVGPEDMSKGRFVFMSLLPNFVFGVVPFAIAMVLPQYAWLGIFGALALTAGAGDYFNVYNALTQMPKGARTYLYKMNSYWYVP